MENGIISTLFLYSEPRCKAVDFEEIREYLAQRLGSVKIVLRGPLFEEAINACEPEGAIELWQKLAQRLAGCRVTSMDTQHDSGREPLYGEVDYERRRLQKQNSGVFGILYDAYELAGVMASVLPTDKRGLDHLHVVFTNQLIGTWDGSDRRYHARTILMGSSPVVVSLSGLVEAPAKARGYYLARCSAETWGLAEEKKMELAGEFAEERLCHGDPRLTEAVKGYVLQAAAYRMTGIPFCEDPDCRLYNSHWQKELIRSQLGTGQELCPRHDNLFNRSSERSGESLWTSDYMS